MAYKLLVQEEKLRLISLIEEDSSRRGMVFSAEYKKNNKSHFQGSRMTFRSNGNKLVVAGTGKRPFCNHCKYPGHTMDTCYRLHGYPLGFVRGKGKPIATVAQVAVEEQELDDHTTHVSAEQFNSILKALQDQHADSPSQAHVAGTCLLTCSNVKWIVDIGATDHICANLELFESYRIFDKHPNTITIADGKQVIVEHIGTICFDIGIVLQNVLHVPGLKFNLIFTHKLCADMNCEITFTHDKCLIQGPTLHQSVVLGNLAFGLYTVNNKPEKKQEQQQEQHVPELTTDGCGLVSKIDDNAKLWHLRMGHMPFNKL
ncbi:unnamed protein product [Amaranthus hypochondriacus]